jgi:hypothetical protein
MMPKITVVEHGVYYNDLVEKTSLLKRAYWSSVEVKMRRVFLVMAACCLMASPALAGGGVDLYGAYSEVVDGEGSFGLGARLSIGGTHWMFDAAATGFLEIDDIRVIDENPEENESVKYRALDLGLRYLFYDGHKLRPYLGVGFTYAYASATNIQLDGGLGLYGMAGLRYGKTPGVQLMAELMYRWTEIQAKYNFVNEQDIDIGGLGLQVGVSFVF